MPPKKDLVRYREVRVADLQNDQKTAAQILNAPAASITQEQFQEFVLSQIKRIIHGDHPGLWRDDFVSSGIFSLQDLSLGESTFEADCLVTDAVGAAVRITGPAILGFKQVTTCDISVVGGYPAVGLILQKSAPTRCTVQTSGFFVTGAVLVPGATYFVDFSGMPAPAPLGPSISGRAAIQAIGTAVDSNVLSLAIGPTRFIRAG